VVYVSADGHVHELYDALGAGSWAHNDLTGKTGAPAAAGGSSLAAWVDPSYQHVVYVSADGHVHELYDALGAGSWAHNDLTGKTGAPAAAGGSSLAAWVDVAAHQR
jgi:hypothetical protein